MFCRRFNKITMLEASKCMISKCSHRNNSSGSDTPPQPYRSIPSPKGLPFIGTTLDIMKEGGSSRIHMYVDKRHKQLGPIFKDKIGPVRAVFLSEPKFMQLVTSQEGKYPLHLQPDVWTLYNQVYGCRRGLFFMDGPEWWHNRRVMNRSLLKGDREWIRLACDVVSVDMVERWGNEVGQAGVIPKLESELYNWSLQTIIAVLLGHNYYDTYKHSLYPTLNQLGPTVKLIFEYSVPFLIFPSMIAHKLHLPIWNRFVSTINKALTMTNQLIDQLQHDFPQSDGLLTRMNKEEISKPDIANIIVDLILAAGDTTAYTMAWMLYLLGKNKHVQDKVRESNNFQYVLKETLRLYPVAPFITRIMPQDCVVGNYEIPSGTLMLYSLYTSGRNRQYFTEPDKFFPDRWKSEVATPQMKQCSIPFGFGVRSCVGKKMAEFQLDSLLSRILSNFSLDVDNKREVEMVLKMITVPSQPIRLILNKL